MAQAFGKLEAFASKQALLLEITNIGGVDRVRDSIGEFTGELDREMNIDAILSVAGSRVGASKLLAELMIETGQDSLLGQVDSKIEAEAYARPASALASFRPAWLKARGGQSAASGVSELASAAARNDVAGVGLQLLGTGEVKGVKFGPEELPESVVRRPPRCSLLDVSVGAGSLEVSKYLLEFHEAPPTRETLKQALSFGNLELIRLIEKRLPEAELERRADLLEVAGDFHQLEPLAWLFRDARMTDRELFVAFALERHLADGLVVVLEGGFQPWWGRSSFAVRRAAGGTTTRRRILELDRPKNPISVTLRVNQENRRERMAQAFASKQTSVTLIAVGVQLVIDRAPHPRVLRNPSTSESGVSHEKHQRSHMFSGCTGGDAGTNSDF
jgi:hypothetical protein